MKNNTLAAAAAVALAASLAGCSGSNTIEEPSPAASTAQAQAQVQPAPAQAPAQPTTAAAQNGTAAFGGSVTFPDGVKVSVSQPQAVPAGQYASGAVQGKITVFSLSVTNGSDQMVNGAMLWPKVTYGAAGKPAMSASSETIGGEYFGNILPGETQTVKVGYGVPPAEVKSVRVEVSSFDLTGTPAVFKAQ